MHLPEIRTETLSAVERECICKLTRQAEPRRHVLLRVVDYLFCFFPSSCTASFPLLTPLRRIFLSFPSLRRNSPRLEPGPALPSSPSLPLSCCLPPAFHFVASLLPPLPPPLSASMGTQSGGAGGTHSRDSALLSVTRYLLNTPPAFQGVLIPLYFCTQKFAS